MSRSPREDDVSSDDQNDEGIIFLGSVSILMIPANGRGWLSQGVRYMSLCKALIECWNLLEDERSDFRFAEDFSKDLDTLVDSAANFLQHPSRRPTGEETFVSALPILAGACNMFDLS